eukprot:CAMPEP_0185251244 /NCGR_PEP_ID=MMETSP1359-20130426/671_1 /TAXON_ID=552665 /ORGANISM="Bigelowiella longifila, Strain CCMP242" /LENGTH=151 /DNA_ID=CAMNT_0027833055 /DNA_START=50 /DNA_END=506 /DNA_ORIENTATION=+
MAQASWNGAIVAETKTFVTVEGNIYFPPEALKKDYFKDSDHTSVCGWKGSCNYYNLNVVANERFAVFVNQSSSSSPETWFLNIFNQVEGKLNTNCAFVYKNPKPAAIKIKDHVAFWKGVKVEQVDPDTITKWGDNENKIKTPVQGKPQTKK